MIILLEWIKDIKYTNECIIYLFCDDYIIYVCGISHVYHFKIFSCSLNPGTKINNENKILNVEIALNSVNYGNKWSKKHNWKIINSFKIFS